MEVCEEKSKSSSMAEAFSKDFAELRPSEEKSSPDSCSGSEGSGGWEREQEEVGAGSLRTTKSSEGNGWAAKNMKKRGEGNGGGGRQQFPQRPDEPDCEYYVKTGTCWYGMSCKFNHPPKKKEYKMKGQLGDIVTFGSQAFSTPKKFPAPNQDPKEETRETLPSRVTETECKVDEQGQDDPSEGGTQLHHEKAIEEKQNEKVERKETKYEKVERQESENEKVAQKGTEYDKVEENESENEKVEQNESENEKVEQKETENEKVEQEETENENVEQEEIENEKVEQEETEYEKVEQKETENEKVEQKETEKPAQEKVKETIVESGGRKECKFYSMPGGCKYGGSCRYAHYLGKSDVGSVELNFLGLPIRPGERQCSFYMRTGNCKYSANCKFHHPDPTADSGRDPTGYSNGEARKQNTSGTSQVPISPWPEPRTMNEAIHFLDASPSYIPGMILPQVVHPHQDWNGYRVPVLPPEMHVQSISASAMSHASIKSDIPVHQQAPINEYPERPGQPECQYFMKSGTCKFKSNCKFHHPQARLKSASVAILNPIGLPLNPGIPVCSHYTRFGICSYGSACKFQHPVFSIPHNNTA
ncbi:zinc finger CCCH domain-containing protein 43-like isoform X2 [Ananas comosus]|uniref:Zinc finger CCCH domain-containing protein 43-like isoform X2 n=1 Tax=Ananas comosus TaxID=4615 RepID=A0A6P5GVF0_ANACO|nr:zinc finger CCCH domain-containing protein 43-like isoform X2 [Ananas comosus]